MTDDNDIPGQNGRKLSAEAKRYAEQLAKYGLHDFDIPGRRGRPMSPATLFAKKRGGSARTARRHMAIMRNLVSDLGITPQDLADTSLRTIGEQHALLKLNHAMLLPLLPPPFAEKTCLPSCGSLAQSHAFVPTKPG